MLCWKQKDATLFDGNEHYQRVDFTDIPKVKVKKKDEESELTLLEFHWSNSKLYSVGLYMCEPQTRVLQKNPDSLRVL